MLNIIKKYATNAKWYSHITVEPSYALYYFIEHLCSFFHENLLLQKACRSNATTEPDLYTPCDDEKRGISYVTYTHSYLNLPNTPLMILIATFMISWSDKSGKRRKPIILLPLVGIMFEIFFACLHSYFWYWPVLAVVLTRNITRTMSGGIILFHSSCSLFITDITNEKNRMSRIGILAMIPHFCIPLSSLISGYFLKNYGFLYCYSACFVLSGTALVFGIILIKDVSVPVVERTKICSVLNPLNVLKSAKIVFRKRPFRKRTILILLVFAKMSNNFAITGEHSVFYLYLRHRFHWNEVQFSMFTAYRHVGLIFGTFISLLVLSKLWKLHDGVIGAISCFWNGIGALGYFFAYENWHLYAIPWLEMFHSVSKVSAKSLMTKIVDQDELGHLFSVMMIINSVIPINKLLYNTVFRQNLDTMPNSFYLISVVMAVIGFISYSLSYKFSKKGYVNM